MKFRDKFHVPVWCGEWGAKTGAPGYTQWLHDVADILETNHFDWCIWAWAVQPKDLENTTFDINPKKTRDLSARGESLSHIARRQKPNPKNNDHGCKYRVTNLRLLGWANRSAARWVCRARAGWSGSTTPFTIRCRPSRRRTTTSSSSWSGCISSRRRERNHARGFRGRLVEAHSLHVGRVRALPMESSRGVPLEAVGTFENPFHAAMGSPIRSEIWACLFPGDPDSAAHYAGAGRLARPRAGGHRRRSVLCRHAKSHFGRNAADRIDRPRPRMHSGSQRDFRGDVLRDGPPRERPGRVALLEGALAATETRISPTRLERGPHSLGAPLRRRRFREVDSPRDDGGYDTDCTAATVGATLGMESGRIIPERWSGRSARGSISVRESSTFPRRRP